MTGRKRVPATTNCQIRLSDQERRSAPRRRSTCPRSAARRYAGTPVQATNDLRASSTTARTMPMTHAPTMSRWGSSTHMITGLSRVIRALSW
jgi:hypothetical protein